MVDLVLFNNRMYVDDCGEELVDASLIINKGRIESVKDHGDLACRVLMKSGEEFLLDMSVSDFYDQI